MQITESFTLSKTGRQDNNEDMLLINDRFIAVVDGVTPKMPAPDGAAVSGGRFASQTLCDLLGNTALPTDPRQLLTCLNDGLKQAIADSVFASQEEPPAASIVFYDHATGQIISYGDCQLLYRQKAYKREKLLDQICAEKRAVILKECLQNGQKEADLLQNDPGRRAVEPDILGSFLQYANRIAQYGFPVLGTGEIVADYIDIYPVTLAEEIVLASDGYPVLLPTLQESEQALEKIIAEDPLLIYQYQSTKGVSPGNTSYDDRTYIRFVVR